MNNKLLILFCFVLILPMQLFAEGPELSTEFSLVSNTHGSPTATQGTLVLEFWGWDNQSGTNYTRIQEKCYLDANLRSQFVSISFSDHFYSEPNYTITEDYDPATGRIEFIYQLNSGYAPEVAGETRFVRVTIVYNLADAYSTITLGTKEDEPESKWWDGSYWEWIYNRSRLNGLVNIPLGAAPSVTTNAVSNIQFSSATGGGEVTNDMGASVTARGVCWSTSQNPTTSDSHTSNGTGTGTFTSELTNLSGGTVYYVRAYATNSFGTSYGNQVSFTTRGAAVTTNDVIDITTETATCGGNVTGDDGSTVTERGICYGTSENPTILNNKIADVSSGLGEYTISLTGLTKETTYHIRAYATNSYGTSYGNDVSFTTLSTSPGTALNFDGSNDYVSISDNNDLDFTNSGTYTIEAWIKVETFGALKGIVSKYQNSSAYGYFLRLKNTSTAKGLCIDGYETADNILEANKWYHVAAVNNGGTRHLYLNGVEQSLTSVDPCNVQANDNALCIGRDFGQIVGNRYFDGSIDEVRIWNVVRTSQQIRENMHKTPGNTGGGLVCYWQYNDGSGSILRNVTNGNLNGTLTNMDDTNWITSSIPAGGGTSNSENNFTSGTTTSLGNVQLTTTEDFDNAVDLVCTEINRAPNTTSGITGDAHDKYFVINAYTAPGSFSVDLVFTLPEGYITAEDLAAPSRLKLYSRSSNSDGDWSLVTAASSATATTVTFNGVTSFSQFFISSSPLPYVTTNDVTDIEAETATCGGNVTSDGGSTITARGVCWSTSENPTTSDSHTTDGSGIGAFTSSITGLSLSTTYYVRAYATNSSGTSYGSQVIFTTTSGLPTVTTSAISNIAASTAAGGGNVTDEGSSNVTARGVCWSTSANPTIADNHTTDGEGTGSFTSSITGLSEQTTYHVRAYATNSFGTAYGDDVSFTTEISSPGYALSFAGSGSNDYVSGEGLPDVGNGLTIETWVYNRTLPASIQRYITINSEIACIRHDGSNQQGQLHFYIKDSGNRLRDLRVNNVLETNKWYHIAACYSGSGMRLYVNGVLRGSTSDYGTLWLTNGAFNISSSSETMDGYIDEIRVWDRARTQDEIRSDMHRTLNGDESGLILYFQCNNGSGSSTVTDIASGHNGTLNNMDVNNSWVTSTIPAGNASSNNQNTFTSGTATLGNVQLTTTENFDNAVDLVCTEINCSPNTTSGITESNVFDKYYVLKAYGTPGNFSTNLTFTLPDGSISEADQSTPSNLKLYKRDNNADGEWSLIALGSSATSTTVTFNGITSFSQFIIASESSPLPVELVSFTAVTNETTVILNWQTATEVNNYGFEVERYALSAKHYAEGKEQSAKSKEWEKIGFVQGSGNSNSVKEYSFVDKYPKSGKVQYRLKQIDFDGKYEYSPPRRIEVTFETPARFELAQNYPNPFNPETTIKFDIPEPGFVTLKVYDILGSEIKTLVNQNKNAGSYSVKFNGAGLASGIYIYRLITSNFNSTKKLLLLK